MAVECFVIHLARSTERRPAAEALLKATGLRSTILDACDGRAMTDAERASVVVERLFEPRYPFGLNPGEIGCFLSHRRAWERIVTAGLEAALILEDDVRVDPAVFPRALDLARNALGQIGYIQFQVRNIEGRARIVATRDETRLIAPELIPLRTSAQLVSIEAARTLLSLSDWIDRPVDAFLQMRWETGVPVGCVVPSGVSDMTDAVGGSTISKSRSVWSEVARGVKRHRYRAAIRRLSRASF